MKFHEMKEGKKYKATYQGGLKSEYTYFKKNGLLMVNGNICTSVSRLRMKQVDTMDFTEIPQYVTFEEAVKHMRKGGEARFQDSFQTYSIINELLFKGEVVSAFETVLMEPDWILL